MFALLASPLARYGFLALGAAVAAGSAYLWAYGRGQDACEAEHLAIMAETLQRQQAIASAAQARGDKLSADLAATQRKLQATEKEYLTYANAITGNCPADLGVLIGAASRGDSLPEATGAPASKAPPIDAAPLAANIAINYPRCFACYAQLNALIDWHTADEKDMK